MDTQVTLQEIVISIWESRKKILWPVLGALVIGLFVILISPVEYESKSSLLIEDQNRQARGGGLIQQYGGMLGIDGSSSNQSIISPSLFPQIIEGLPFQISLMKEDLRFSNRDTTVTAFNYFDEIHQKPLTETIAKYTIGLPSRIENLFSPSSPSEPLEGSSNKTRGSESVYSISRDSLYVSGKLKGRISISIESGENIVVVTTEMPDPYAAANLGANTIELLKEHIKEYRTKKAAENLEYARKQLETAEKNFNEAQERLAEFRDSNVNLSTAKAETRLQRLESEYDLTFNIYNSLAERVEELKLKLQEETPGFTTIEPFQVPHDNSKPNVLLILFASVFLGLVGSIGYILVSDQWHLFISAQQDKES